MKRHSDDPERGCSYCADTQNMGYGHVRQVSSSELRGTLLLRCPRCGWLYETHPSGLSAPIHLTVAEAIERFGNWDSASEPTH